MVYFDGYLPALDEPMLFSRRPQPGWLAIDMRFGHVDIVHARCSADHKPEIAFCESFPKEGSEADTLARLRKELRLGRYRCTTLLKSEHYQMHQFEAPNVPPAEVKAAMRWRVKDALDYPIEAAIVEVLDIPVDRAALTQTHALYAISARTSTIETCIKPFTDAHVPLAAIDIPDLAQRNIAALFEADVRGVAMLVFEEGEGVLTFSSGGELYLVRRIEVAYSQLNDPNEATRQRHFERIALEVQRSLDHVDSQYHHVPIARLMLMPLPQEVGLQEFLAANLYIPVETIDLAQVLDLHEAPALADPAVQARYLATIGAALRNEEAVPS